MKLELKHLAPYLPYKLKAVKGVTRIETTACSLELPHVYHTSYLGSRRRVMSIIEDIKPILRPLSDLTKEITVNGETFVPIDYFVGEDSDLVYNSLLIHKDYSYLPYNLILLLLEWHFDIFGLIENNLAIDINTL